VRRSIADDTVRSASGYSKTILRRECLRKTEEEIGSAMLALSVVPSRASEDKEAREWHVAGWLGSRNGGCARSRPEAGAAGSDVGIHRARESSGAVRFCGRSRASER